MDRDNRIFLSLLCATIRRDLGHAALAGLMLISCTTASATNLLGIEATTEQAPQVIAGLESDGQHVTATFTRGTVLIGHAVPNLWVVMESREDKIAAPVPSALFDIPGLFHPIPGVEQQSQGAQTYAEYTLVVLRIAPGISFEQCEAQMAKVLKLARRYGAQPLETWRVVGKAKGLPDADLFGLVGWSSGASALRFALKLKSEEQGIRRAHDLNDENALVIQVKPL